MNTFNFIMRSVAQGLAIAFVLVGVAMCTSKAIDDTSEGDRNWNHAHWDGCKRTHAIGRPHDLTWIYQCPDGGLFASYELRSRISPNRQHWISLEKK